MKPFFILALTFIAAGAQAVSETGLAAARGVLARFAGESVAETLRLETIPDEDGCAVYEVADHGRTLRGSSPVALCKAFYANTTAKGAGICSWTGSRFDAAAAFAPSAPVRVVAPFRHYQYFNVVTFGYTMPFWDEARWMREIDWMALHGIDMPLALIANEAIAGRVWRSLGLTQEEIDAASCGPAHLPWMRMGNLSGRPDAPLPMAWQERSIRIQHAVLKQMRALGMKPIVPGFAGFVPQALTRVRPEAKLLKMNWSGFHAWFLSPDQPLFRELGRRFVEEWEKEFGSCDYWLADSFNEMKLPWKTEAETLQGLAACGEHVFQAIQDAHPGATWVMQGWMFGYDRAVWSPARAQALLSRVPNNRLLILDMAVNYNAFRWRNGMNWRRFPGFFGKRWVWSTITNMGGKSLPGEPLEWLANAHLEALADPERGALEGYGIAPEGIENNDVIYELLTAAGWRREPLDLRAWLRTYSRCRYGADAPGIEAFWEAQLAGAYHSQEPHPFFCWQKAPGGSRGSFRGGEHTLRAAEALAACSDTLKNAPLYALDLREQTAFAAGVRLETVLRAEQQARESGDPTLAAELQAKAEALFQGIDAVLRGHPTLDLRSWIAQARAAAENNPALADAYETNARRIISIWGPPVNDYACRVWSGLVGGYYLPRYQRWWAAQNAGQNARLSAFEQAWVEQRTPLPEPAASPSPEALLQLIRSLPATLDAPTPGERIGAWSPADLGTGWRTLSWNVPEDRLRAAKRLRFRYTQGRERLDIREVTVEMDGAAVQTFRPQEAFAGTPSRCNVFMLSLPPEATGNNGCRIRAVVRGHKSPDSSGVVELL